MISMLTIEYTAQLRRSAGVAGETIELRPGETLREVALRLAERHGDDLRRQLVNQDGTLERSVLVFVGDEQVTDYNAPLKDGQTITFAAPISGG